MFLCILLHSTAARLARPEARVTSALGHADRKKSAVSSTPFGVMVPTMTTNKRRNNSTVALPGGRHGDDEDYWCGPFSVARQMIAERERAAKEAAEEQEAEQQGADHPLDIAMQELENKKKRKEHPSIQWKAAGGNNNLVKNSSSSSTKRNQESVYAKRQRRANVQAQQHKIPSLFSKCISFLVDNIDAVESLGQGVDSNIRTQLAKQLVAHHKLDGTSLQSIIEPGMDALQLVDCSQIHQTSLSNALKSLLPSGLKFLSLDQAGRCFGPHVVQDMIRCTSSSSSSSSSTTTTTTTTTTSQLAGLSIGGAYLFKDEDAAALLTALKSTLVSLEFKACPLLGLHLCRTLADTTTATTTSTTPLLELSLEDLNFSSEAWTALLSSSTSPPSSSAAPPLGKLESLRLRSMSGLTDAMVAQLLQRCGKTLQRLDLSHNHELTDGTLAAIREYCCSTTTTTATTTEHHQDRLRHLYLCNLKHLTNAGLQALFTHVPAVAAAAAATGGSDTTVSPPPRLETLDLGRCDYQAVTDEVIVAVTQASVANSTTTTTRNDANNNNGSRSSGTTGGGGLVRLNIQGSSMVTDTSMEHLAATSADTLRELNISFCGRISDNGLGYLVDQCNQHVLQKLQIFGCAQLTDVFFEGHSRVQDAHLEIVGAWIKSKRV